MPVLLVAAVPAEAQLCAGESPSFSADGRAFGHLPYGEVAPGELVPAPPDVAIGACALRPEAMADLTRLVAASAGQVRAISCHRGLAYQQMVFCRERGTQSGDRALSVAPPGHSEHATGYALDFAFFPPQNGCPPAEACVAATPAFRWLVANAGRYGFEMSFPAGNRQNVKWEPWHWRWVGATADVPGAARARQLFAAARTRFPAELGVDTAVRIGSPPPVAWLGALPTPVCRRGKCKVAKVR